MFYFNTCSKLWLWVNDCHKFIAIPIREHINKSKYVHLLRIVVKANFKHDTIMARFHVNV